MVTLLALIVSILSSLYSTIQDSSIDTWLLDFIFDICFVFAICIPGSRITTLARRVKKRTNKLRALTYPEDARSIQDIDSFLLYLLTNEATFKVMGISFRFFILF
jgi:hypothetical protein